MKSKRVFITGMGVVAPNGVGIKEFSDSLFTAKSGIRKVDELEKLGFNCQVGGICPVNFDNLIKRIPALSISNISRSTFLALTACLEALENSGLLSNYDLENTNDLEIIIGSTIGSGDLWGDKIIPMVNSNKHLQLGSSAFEQVINSSPVAMIAGFLGISGRTISTSLACASGTEAIIDAANKIRRGDKKIIIAGGVEPYSKYYWATMDAMRITNPNYNHTPTLASRPMSETARGFVPAEGSAILILEAYEHALNRGAPLMAEIAGGYINCGGQRNGGSMTASNIAKLEECLTLAIKDAGIKPKDLDYISGHLTSTKSDPIEIEAWVNILSLAPDDFPFINSTKSLIGHSLGACGAIETVASVIQMNNRFIHASINCEDVHPRILKCIKPEKIAHQRIDNTEIHYIAKANFGFGDVNACLIIKNPNE